jgi:mono/diheme cytochrome c family protein
VPSLVILPALGWWYIRRIPRDLWAGARGPMPTATEFAGYAVVLLAVALMLALLTLVRPAKMHLSFSLLLLLAALGAMGSFEFVRESIRKPYIIANYLYANSLYSMQIPGDGGLSVDEVSAKGVLQSAKWIEERELNAGNQMAAGREIFRVECQSCHTPNAYRGVKHFIALRQWDERKIQAMLGGLMFMHNGAMPPFAGTDAERGALATYLSSIGPVTAEAAAAARDGRTIYEQNCSMCHRVAASDELFTNLASDLSAASESLKDLTSLFPLMPDLKLSDQQRVALVAWINTQRDASGFGKVAQRGNRWHHRI